MVSVFKELLAFFRVGSVPGYCSGFHCADHRENAGMGIVSFIKRNLHKNKKRVGSENQSLKKQIRKIGYNF